MSVALALLLIVFVGGLAVLGVVLWHVVATLKGLGRAVGEAGRRIAAIDLEALQPPER